MGSPFGGSNFQSNLGGVGVPGNINNAFNQSYGLASNLGGVGAPGSKDPLNLQNLQPAYAGIRDWTRGNIVGETPQMMGMAQNASQMGMSSADMMQGMLPGLQGLSNLMSGAVPGLMSSGRNLWTTGGSDISSMMGQAPGLEGYAGQALDTAFDPQQALYQRSLHDMLQAQQAQEASAGLSGSPYGAGLTADATNKFLQDWQNQQVAREQAGAGTAGSLYQTIAGLPTAGEGIANLGLAGIGAGGQLAQGAAGIDTTAGALGTEANQLAMSAANDPLQMIQNLSQARYGNLDAFQQARTNMYNQRSTGMNALDQYIQTAGNFLNSLVGAQAQNLTSSEAGLNTILGGGGALAQNLSPLIHLGK